MPVVKITTQGLCSITVLTALLWGCIFLERRTIAHARAEACRALDEIRTLQLKKRIVPVSAPAFPRSDRPAAG
jgi:hypothetical protein